MKNFSGDLNSAVTVVFAASPANSQLSAGTKTLNATVGPNRFPLRWKSGFRMSASSNSTSSSSTEVALITPIRRPNMEHMIKKLMITSMLLAIAGAFTAFPANAQLGTGTGTTTLNVTVGAEAGLTVAATSNLTSVGTNFTSFTGSTALTYYIRTTQSTGAGSITAKVTTDFAPVGGPSVATPPTVGDALIYTSSGTAPGNSATGAVMAFAGVNASTTAQTNVATFGADNRSVFAGNSESVAWTLTNDPKYKTGAYSATVTFTISAT
jgi:hypothetical protein